MPDWMGGGAQDGVELGPATLLDHLRASSAGRFLAPDAITVQVPPAPAEPRGPSGLFYLDQVALLCRRASDAIVRATEEGLLPLALVSEDSTMMGVLSGLARVKQRPLAVVWLDAHGDINTPATSPSGLLFGMPLAHLLGLGHPELLSLNEQDQSIDPRHLVLVGVRALDPGERSLIENLSIRTYGVEAFRRQPPDQLADQVAGWLQAEGAGHLHIHLDLDVIDPEESPGVSLPEPGGVPAAETIEFVRELAATSFAGCSFSISQYNPKRDPSGITLAWALRAIESFVDGRGWNAA